MAKAEEQLPRAHSLQAWLSPSASITHLILAWNSISRSCENWQNGMTNCWPICKRPRPQERATLMLPLSSKNPKIAGEPPRNDTNTRTLNIFYKSTRNTICHRIHFKNCCRILFSLVVLCKCLLCGQAFVVFPPNFPSSDSNKRLRKITQNPFSISSQK